MKQKNNTNKIKSILLAILLAITVVTTITSHVSAAGEVVPKCANDKPVDADGKCPLENPNPGYLVGGQDFNDFGDLLTRAIGWMLYFAAGIAVLFLLVGGFQYISARGNEEATEKAKKTITGAVIGIIIIIMAYAIVTIVSNLVTTNPGA